MAFLSVRCRHLMSLLLEDEDMMELSDDILPRFSQMLPYIEHLIVEAVRNFTLGPALLELENVCRFRKSLIIRFPNHATLAIQIWMDVGSCKLCYAFRVSEQM